MQQGFRWLLVLSLLATFIVVTPSAVRAETLTVTSTLDSGPGSLRQVVSDASSGDTIDFNIAGDGPHTITLTTGQITLDKNLTISGPGAAQLTVARSSADGTAAFRIFEIVFGTTVTIDGLTISNGRAISGTGEAIFGGGIYNRGTLTVTSSTISDNSATIGGGGIFNANAGTLTVTSSTISGNSATTGGGIDNANAGTLTITSSTISGNSATDFGGGIYNISTLNLTSSTISGNSATDFGGIYNAGTLTVTSSTISGNSATFFGGGIRNAGTLTVTSSIVAGNTGDNVSGPITSGSNNLIDVNPMLAGLADNGGPTWTMLPQPDSPAINAGGDTCPDVDQRGVDRQQGIACDIGAVEVRFPSLTIPANLIIPATSPAGASATFSASATDWEGNATAVACQPASGTTFPIGETTVTCTTVGEVDHDVSDSFTVTVLGGSGQLTVLITDVRTGPGSTLVKSRLLVMLQAADLSLRRGQTGQACTLLAGFATTVQLYGAARLIPAGTAAEWRADAIQIRGALGCR